MPTLSVLNTFMQIAAKDSSATTRNLVGQLLITTECMSSVNVRDGKAPTLPLSFVDLVIYFALEDFRSSKDPSAILKLLHTSNIIRCQVVRAFRPVTFFDLGSSDSQATLFVNPRMIPYIWHSLFQELSDFSLKRHGLVVAPKRLDCANFAGSKGNFAVQHLAWTVEVITDNLLRRDGSIAAHGAMEQQSFFSTPIDTSVTPLLTVFDAYDLLDHTFSSFDAATWRFASPFQRALNGNLDDPAASASVRVTLELPLDKDGKTLGRTWHFETQSGAAWQYLSSHRHFTLASNIHNTHFKACISTVNLNSVYTCPL